MTRAAIWYARDGVIRDCEPGGIKAVRECENITIENCRIVCDSVGEIIREDPVMECTGEVVVR